MKSSGIGGQAVMEGVMMKNQDKYAVAVRKPDNDIEVKVSEYKALAERYPALGLPIIRGVVAFVESLVIGMKTLTYSASFYDEEPSKENKESKPNSGKAKLNKNNSGNGTKKNAPKNAKQKAAEKNSPDDSSPEKTASKSDTKEKLTIAATVALSIILAVGIFMILPYFLSRTLSAAIESDAVLAIIEGVIRIALFLGYIIAISQMNDIKRVFMYHGAEHKSINCIEDGCDLTVENVRTHSRLHKRCGTSFMLIVMCVSIVLFMFIRTDTAWLRVVLRLVLVPIVAGISYEFIKLAGRSDNPVVTALSKPGLLLQRLTTKEPDDSMIEVAIRSVEAVYDWHPFVEEVRAMKEKAEEEAASAESEEEKTEKAEEAETAEIVKKVKPAPVAEDEIEGLDVLDVEFKGSKKNRKKADPSELIEEIAENLDTADEEYHEEEERLSDEVVEKQLTSFRESASEFGITSDDDEDDEILRKLDKFFETNKGKKKR